MRSAMAGGVPAELPADAPLFMKDFQDYYKTPHGYHARSLNSNEGWQVTTDEIESAVLNV